MGLNRVSKRFFVAMALLAVLAAASSVEAAQSCGTTADCPASYCFNSSAYIKSICVFIDEIGNQCMESRLNCPAGECCEDGECSACGSGCIPWKTSCRNKYIFQHYYNCDGEDTVYCEYGCQLVDENTAECKDPPQTCSYPTCNIGWPACNTNPPPKEYTVPTGQTCTYTGTIQNVNTINHFPPYLHVRGNGNACNIDVAYPGCGAVSYSATCGPGTVTITADDSGYVTIKQQCSGGPRCGDGHVDPGEECEKNSQCDDGDSGTTDRCVNCKCKNTQNPYCGDGDVDPGEECESDSQCSDGNPTTLDYCSNCECFNDDLGFCGDGNIDPGEECELPTTNDNPNCVQSPTTTCSGMRTGVRDGYGYCSLACGCAEDTFAFTCMEGSCGAECDSNEDCDDTDPNTIDTCTSQCTCIHTDNPYCGDGDIDTGEDCEEDVDCGPGRVCSECRCTIAPYCGDGNRDGSEDCDYGMAVNGIPCVPPMNGSCTYCTDSCEWASLTGGSCGNYIQEYGEQCDVGENNGNICTPRCDDFCAYCDSTCRINFVDGPTCDVPCVDCVDPTPDPVPSYPCGTGYCPVPYYIGYTPRVRASICGDGIIGIGEECDDGYDNGIACSPACNGDCSYCDANCQKVVMEGAPCVRTALPWDPVKVNPCRTIAYPIGEARLDTLCDGNGRYVTGAVNWSDNQYAYQYACLINSSNIFLDFFGIVPGMIQNITLVLEHREENAHLRVEYFDGDHWLHQCSLAASERDIRDECQISGVKDFVHIPLKVRVFRSGTDAFEALDQAFLAVEYCAASTSCGDGHLGVGEECDDGNALNGDGCNEFCAREYLMCGDWSSCMEGKQTQNCFYGDSMRVNVRRCGSVFFFENFMIILLIILLVLLVLFFLFFPALYMSMQKRRKEREKERKQ